MIRASVLLVLTPFLFALGCDTSDSPTIGAHTSDTAASQVLDPMQVPESLRHLVPFANQWGIGDDIDRMERIQRSSAADREELAMALTPHQTEVTAWLDSLEAATMSDEAAAFMYMQLALEEMP